MDPREILKIKQRKGRFELQSEKKYLRNEISRNVGDHDRSFERFSR